MEFRGASLNEYDKLVIRMSTPRVVIDNVVCATATLVKVDSAREHGILLDAVQALTDMNLCIKKAYISSDGRWFMDGIYETLARSSVVNPESLVPSSETALELMGTDRSGLLSEVFAVLAELSCRVVNATVWTHRGRIASLIHVKEEESGNLIEDAHKISRIEDRLRNVLKGDSHGYSVVNVQCKDRPKLLFDIICTLTYMQYIVFHATIDTRYGDAFQEFYIRHTDGSPVNSEAERQRVIQCLRAAIQRRATEGVKLEFRTGDRRGLLSEVTRAFHENGLLVTRAEVSTVQGQAVNTFYVSDASGNPVEPKAIELVWQRVGLTALQVKEDSGYPEQKRTSYQAPTGVGGGAVLLSLGSLVRRNLYILGLIRSCS